MHFLHICIGAQYLLNHIWEIWRFAPDWSAIQLPGLESKKKSFIDSQSTAWLYFWSRLWGIKSSPFFWISAGICCQKIHRRGSGGWKEMWSRCSLNAMLDSTFNAMIELLLDLRGWKISFDCFLINMLWFSLLSLQSLATAITWFVDLFAFVLLFEFYAGHCCAPLWILPRPAKSSWSCRGGPPSPPWRTPSPWTTPGIQYSWRMLN